MQPRTALVLVKLVHSIAWVFFAGCIVLLPIAALAGHHGLSGALALIVLAEVLVLAANGWSCPLTAVAARYTADRAANFDIYLPIWIARYNKQIFGPLYALGLVVALWQWLG